MLTAEYIIPVFAAWLLALLLGRPAIPFLHRLHVDQTERAEGPASHQKKSGTPTMGGVIFILPAVAVSLCYAHRSPEIIAVLIPTIGYGLIGFIDDYIKVVWKRNLGLRAWQKLLGQLAVTLLFALYLRCFTPVSLAMRVPFLPGRLLDLGWLNLPALIFIALCTTNGTNLTDGVDGLCASVTAVIAAFFTAAAFALGGFAGPADAWGRPEHAAFVACAFLGGLLGYLFYNVYPGRVMMGDTGSLAIGGFVLGMAYVLQLPLFIPIAGVIYAAEVVSVILQVSYFRLTHGKRIFRMSPLHHHFELGGWSETRVVNVFTTVTILGCLLAYAGLIR